MGLFGSSSFRIAELTEFRPLSVCEQFASQLCQTDANFKPAAAGATTYCYQLHASDTALTNAGCGGENIYTSRGYDVTGDGVADSYCLYVNENSVEDCNTKFPVDTTISLLSASHHFLTFRVCYIQYRDTI